MEYTRSSAKKQKEKERSEPQVLVGFGKKDLCDLMLLRGTAMEMDLIRAPLKAPPRWRRASACTEKEIACFLEFTGWIKNKVNDQGEIKQNG